MIRVIEVLDKEEGRVKFTTGAMRSNDPTVLPYSLIPPEALRRLALRYQIGLTKYGKNNWQKGIPTDNILDHLLTHLQHWTSGDRSDDHLAGAMWGIATLMHFETFGNPAEEDGKE